MPWDHCNVEFILDDEVCPTCGLTKAQWTVQIDRTRTFVVGRKPRVIALDDIGRVLDAVCAELTGRYDDATYRACWWWLASVGRVGRG